MKFTFFATYSLALILALQGCGSSPSQKTDEDKSPKQEIPEEKSVKLAPIVQDTLAPDEMPDLEKESKSVRAAVTMSVDKSTFTKGDTVKVTLKDMPGRYDWIGLFHEGDKSVKNNLLTYAWTKDIRNGTVSLKLQNSLDRHVIQGLPQGKYEIRAFTRGGAYKQLKSITIDIQNNDQSADNTRILNDNITFDKSNKAVKVQNLQQFYGDWIGLYKKGGGDDALVMWEWVDSDTGTSILWDVPQGEYELRVYDYDNDIPVSTTLTVDWSSSADTTITTYQKSFVENEPIVIHYEDMPGNPDQWIGIFPVDAGNDYEEALTTAWPDYHISGDVTLDPLPAGEYEVRVFHTEFGPVKTRMKLKVIEAQNSRKIALFADEHDPHNRLLAVDYENMELVAEIPVEGSQTHHADVVGDVNDANYVLMIPKGSTFLNVYTVNEKSFVKKIDLPFHPRSADAYNASKNLVLLTSSNRPAAVLLDADKWNIVGTVGMNVSCELKFNEYNYHPWYYKRIVFKNHNIDNPSCSAPDFGGTQISGHPAWLDSNHFAVLDRANRLIEVYKLTYKTKNGEWKTKLTDVIPTSTSLHQLIPSGNHDNIFYGMTEGNGNGDGIAPVIYKWKFKHGRLIQLAKTPLVTTKTVTLMKEAGTYDDYQAFWNQFKQNKQYYKYYYPTNFTNEYAKYYPSDSSSYYAKYYNKFNNYYKSHIKDYKSYYEQNVPVEVQQVFKSLGGHNLYISPAVNGQRYLWAAVASGQTFVVNASTMDISAVVKSAKGSGHVNFQQNGDYAIVTNHKSRKVTIANYKTQTFVKNIELPYANENIFSVLQSHSPYVTLDDKYFHNSWTDGGVFFRIDLDTLELDEKNVYTGGIPIQGNYYPNYKGD